MDIPFLIQQLVIIRFRGLNSFSGDVNSKKNGKTSTINVPPILFLFFDHLPQAFVLLPLFIVLRGASSALRRFPQTELYPPKWIFFPLIDRWDIVLDSKIIRTIILFNASQLFLYYFVDGNDSNPPITFYKH